jgi:acetate kinase
MTQAIGVLNAGSSSLKFGFYAAEAPTGSDPPFWRGQVELGARGQRHAAALSALLGDFESRFPSMQLAAVGHRVVHGGQHFDAPAPVDDEVLREIERLVPLAPQHQPHGVAAIAALRSQRAGLLQVACFDTAFHRTQDPRSERFPLPESLHAAGVRRYGFHGLSYESIASQLPARLEAGAEGRVVVAHLGNGASLAALRERRCVATTMGLTPLDGVMMGTRAGAIDPGVLLYLMREHGYDEPRLARLLQEESGLLGVSGISHDMRVLLESDAPAARFAVALFVQRLVQEIASMAAALDGLDALVFTGGIGEHAPAVREAACERLAWMGVDLDPEANPRDGPRITRSASRVSAWVIPTDEEAVIAGHTRRILSEVTRAGAAR